MKAGLLAALLILAGCSSIATYQDVATGMAAREVDATIKAVDKAKCSLPMSAVERNCGRDNWCQAHFLICPAPNIKGALAE